MKISIIAAMSSNRVIGTNNTLPWKLSADLKRFKQLTMGHCLIMGRKTFESIGRPLPGRTTIVLTHQSEFNPPGVKVVHSVDEAIQASMGDEVFIAGGGELFSQTLSLADRMYLTIIQKDFEGDAFFPIFDESKWTVTFKEEHQPDDQFPYQFSLLNYERKTD
jgi:dihydrofolate reductase